MRTFSDNFSFIESSFDDIKDFYMEPTGSYVLIRIKDGKIECAVVNKENVIIKGFRGKRAQDIYHALFEWEKEHEEYITEKQHLAYLGKELKKAEVALAHGTEYVQE